MTQVRLLNLYDRPIKINYEKEPRPALSEADAKDHVKMQRHLNKLTQIKAIADLPLGGSTTIEEDAWVRVSTTNNVIRHFVDIGAIKVIPLDPKKKDLMGELQEVDTLELPDDLKPQRQEVADGASTSAVKVKNTETVEKEIEPIQASITRKSGKKSGLKTRNVA